MKHIKHYQSSVRDMIRYDLDNNRNFKGDIKAPTEYALISGKRLRPMIVLSIGNDIPINLALFIEYVHNASLVIDDLPCMDNDMERRGQPTLHIRYGQHMAQLVAYNLMITAMKHLSDGLFQLRKIYTPEQFDRMSELVNNEVNENLSNTGICGGQLLDLTDDDVEELSDRLQKERVLKVINLKTGCLFSVSFVLGWVATGIDKNLEHIDEVKDIGMSFGICYQIVDDLRDIKSDTAKNGARNNVCRYFTRNELIDLFSYHLGNYVSKSTKLECYIPVLQELNTYLYESFRKNIVSATTN